MDAWRNGCFGNMDAHPAYTTPNYSPAKIFVQIILATKWLVRQLSRSPTSSNDLCLPFGRILILNLYSMNGHIQELT